MGIVSRGVECLSSHSQWQWEVLRRENGLQAPDVPRETEISGTSAPQIRSLSPL